MTQCDVFLNYHSQICVHCIHSKFCGQKKYLHKFTGSYFVSTETEVIKCETCVIDQN